MWTVNKFKLALKNVEFKERIPARSYLKRTQEFNAK